MWACFRKVVTKKWLNINEKFIESSKRWQNCYFLTFILSNASKFYIWQTFAQNLKLINCAGIFKCNNYPGTLIHQFSRRFLKKIFVPKRTLITVPKFLVLPLLGQLSLGARSRLYNSFNKTLLHCNIKVIFQSKNY